MCNFIGALLLNKIFGNDDDTAFVAWWQGTWHQHSENTHIDVVVTVVVVIMNIFIHFYPISALQPAERMWSCEKKNDHWSPFKSLSFSVQPCMQNGKTGMKT